jgi:hypothetical protein
MRSRVIYHERERYSILHILSYQSYQMVKFYSITLQDDHKAIAMKVLMEFQTQVEQICVTIECIIENLMDRFDGKQFLSHILCFVISNVRKDWNSIESFIHVIHDFRDWWFHSIRRVIDPHKMIHNVTSEVNCVDFLKINF